MCKYVYIEIHDESIGWHGMPYKESAIIELPLKFIQFYIHNKLTTYYPTVKYCKVNITR
jgi:hypothetical protein